MKTTLNEQSLQPELVKVKFNGLRVVNVDEIFAGIPWTAGIETVDVLAKDQYGCRITRVWVDEIYLSHNGVPYWGEVAIRQTQINNHHRISFDCTDKSTVFLVKIVNESAGFWY